MIVHIEGINLGSLSGAICDESERICRCEYETELQIIKNERGILARALENLGIFSVKKEESFLVFDFE